MLGLRKAMLGVTRALTKVPMMPTSISIRIVSGFLLLCVPIFLSYMAIPRFVSGVQMEPERGLVQAAIGGQNIPAASALAAASAFKKAPRGDGNSEAQAAEFLAQAAGGNSTILAQSRQEVYEALTLAPANPRAWILLCEFDAIRSPYEAVHCLGNSYSLARYDWYTANRRMRLIAFEWPYLDKPLRDESADLILPLWNTWPQWTDSITLRPVLYDLSRTTSGRELLRAGFASDRDALRSFNRYVIEERMYGH